MRSKKTTAKAVFILKKAEKRQWVDNWADNWVDKILPKKFNGWTNGWTVLHFINTHVLAVYTIYFCFRWLFVVSWASFDRVIFSVIFSVSCWLSVSFWGILAFICKKKKGKGNFREKLPKK